jgi:hypothetical protein
VRPEWCIVLLVRHRHNDEGLNMDPNAALANLRAALDPERGDSPGFEDALDDAIEAFAALDEWLSKGGFLPAEWAR